ncbi:MAG: hypothetical protein DRP42_04975 [Tenericutes bacterium]|nr:MAG: hypothetical protein DRP42_04975 [Mycoplasmatota bacterium]
MKISDDILKQVAKDYSNLRNRIRFTLSLLNESTTEVEPTDIISKAVLSNINNSFIRILKNYDELDFLSVVKEVMYEVKAGSIQYYFDYVKDIAYILKPDNIKVQEAQFVLRKILDYILYALAPILPTTVEEA